MDWRVGGTANLLNFSPISVEGLERLDLAAREWMGLAAYWLTGKTDAFLPGPEAVATTRQGDRIGHWRIPGSANRRNARTSKCRRSNSTWPAWWPI